MKEITGEQVLAKSLAAQGLGRLFTVPAGRVASLVEAIEREEVIDVVRANNETAAGAMADGYTRRSRKCSVVITEDRGAALCQVSAVTNAWADKIPLLSISLCADDPPDFNKGVERERFDQNGVFGPVTHWRQRIEKVEEIPRLLGEAMNRCSGDKMGPVHLEIPAGLLKQTADADKLSFPEAGSVQQKPIEPPRIAGEQAAVRRAAELIEGAKRPLLFFGGGVNASGAHAQALAFMERWRIPAATTMSGVGTVPLEHELCLGGPSYTAGETFHVAIQEADVVIAVGVAFGGLEGFGKPPLWSGKIKFIQIDMSPYQMGLNVPAEEYILGDARTVLGQVDAELSGRGFTDKPEWEPWRERLTALKRGRIKRLAWDARHQDGAIHQGRLAMELGTLAEREDPLVVIDGGNTPLYAGMYAPLTKPYQIFFPFGMAALGAGIAYAIGVKLASPDKRVILVTGDGSFMYNLQELETIRRMNLPIVIIVNNDSAWNMIRAMQQSLFARRYVGTDLPDLDYARMAAGFGFWSRRVTRVEDILPAYDEAVASGKPALLDCVTDKRNLPDCLLSFTLVEFEGSLKDLDPKKLMKSLWMMRDQGVHRSVYMMTYIAKALLRINPLAGGRGRG